MNRFRKENPQVDFSVEEVTDEWCDANLEAGIYDFGFTIEPVGSELESIPVYSRRISLWVNVRNPLSKKGRIGIGDLEGIRIMTPMPGAKNVDAIYARMREGDVHPKSFTHSQQIYQIFDFVKANKGVGTYIEDLIASSLFDDDEVIHVPFDDFYYTVLLSWKKGRKLSDLERRFIEFVSRSCEGKR